MEPKHIKVSAVHAMQFAHQMYQVARTCVRVFVYIHYVHKDDNTISSIVLKRVRK